MIKKSSALVTLSGILSSVGIGLVGIPTTALVYYAQIAKKGPPPWFDGWIFPMILAGFVIAMIGHAVGGVAGKGQDDIPTLPQVEASTKQAEVNQAVADAAAIANPVTPAKVLVEPAPPKGAS